MSDYKEFLKQKKKSVIVSGFEVDENKLNTALFPFQKFIVKRALYAGKYAIFADCGLGKTLMQLEWAKQVAKYTEQPVLILAPLVVVSQTIQEGAKFGYDISEIGANGYSSDNIYISNYEQLENIDVSEFSGIALDESSILKNYEGAIKTLIIDTFKKTPYKLACTATPSPNDPMELGNHSEFLDVMSRNEMLAMYFVHDGGETAKWRIKGHAKKEFWQFVGSWSIMLNDPKDIGFKMDGYDLPGLNLIEKQIVTKQRENGQLFNETAISATNFNAELRMTKLERMSEVIDIVNSSDETFIIWIKHNEEGDYLKKQIPGAIEVSGSDTNDYKKKMLLGFANGEFRVLITKSKIAAMGMNFQNCHNQIFASLDFSFESLYQSIRRSYRFGQKSKVNIYLITTDTMSNVMQAIETKQKQFIAMQTEMAAAINAHMSGTLEAPASFDIQSVSNDWYKIFRGDCVQLIPSIPDETVGFSIFSPPFAELYTYSSHLEDMGNSKDYNEFLTQFGFLVRELYRVMKQGRNVAVHCMDLPIQKGKEGFIGLRDFSGMLLDVFSGKRIAIEKKIQFMFELFSECLAENGFTETMINAAKQSQHDFDNLIDGYAPHFWKTKMIALKNELYDCKDFIYHSRVTIWKDPVVEMQRTKALGLLHKQVKKDSTMSRVGIPDYLLIFRKDGDRTDPVQNTDIPVDLWQKYASPVWMDINYGNTLQGRYARAENDEKHICPLQLDTIERAIHLYSNKGDVVFTPFMGIGSEAYQAVKMGRKAIGFELKESYYNEAKKNLASCVEEKRQLTLI